VFELEDPELNERLDGKLDVVQPLGKLIDSWTVPLQPCTLAAEITTAYGEPG